MAMADKIAVMNHGVIEQFGPPQEIYDRPATMFVADFIGSPSMNFLTFDGALAPGQAMVRLDGVEVAVPAVREARAAAPLALGVRPEHVRLVADGGLRAEVFGAEYLGTTQIVTLKTAHGALKARLASSLPVRPGETLGLAFAGERLSLFDAGSGRAIASALGEGGHHG